jgi:hypothetical protein
VNPIFPREIWDLMSANGNTCGGKLGSLVGAYFVYNHVSTPNSRLESGGSVSQRGSKQDEKFSQIIPHEIAVIEWRVSRYHPENKCQWNGFGFRNTTLLVLQDCVYLARILFALVSNLNESRG